MQTYQKWFLILFEVVIQKILFLARYTVYISEKGEGEGGGAYTEIAVNRKAQSRHTSPPIHQ
jgi:hypothetical protein